MKLTKEERKRRLLDYAQKFPINDIPGISSIVDEESKFFRVSKIGVKLSGYENEDQMLETGYDDLKSEAHKMHEIWENDEKFARETRNVIRIISYANFDTGWTVLFGHQKPLIDKESSEVIGLVSNFIDVTNNTVFDVGRLILIENNGLKRKQFQYRVQDHEGFEGLSKREQEVLFWYNHGINPKEISIRLSKSGNPISPNTIRAYLAKIKLKLGVATREQLLEKSISIGFMCTVPESLFIG